MQGGAFLFFSTHLSEIGDCKIPGWSLEEQVHLIRDDFGLFFSFLDMLSRYLLIYDIRSIVMNELFFLLGIVLHIDYAWTISSLQFRPCVLP